MADCLVSNQFSSSQNRFGSGTNGGNSSANNDENRCVVSIIDKLSQSSCINICHFLILFVENFSSVDLAGKLKKVCVCFYIINIFAI